MDFSDNIFIGIDHVCKTGFEIRCGFLRQMRAVRVTVAFFDLVFVWISYYNIRPPEDVSFIDGPVTVQLFCSVSLRLVR